jgi:protein-tyrosine-phosphatase
MAAAILKHLAGNRIFVGSAGVRAGEEPDPFAVEVMEELGIDMSRHKPVSLAGVHETGFDLIVTSRLRPRPITPRSILPTAMPSTWNIGRRPIPPSPAAAASRS